MYHREGSKILQEKHRVEISVKQDKNLTMTIEIAGETKDKTEAEKEIANVIKT